MFYLKLFAIWYMVGIILTFMELLVDKTFRDAYFKMSILECLVAVCIMPLTLLTK